MIAALLLLAAAPISALPSVFGLQLGAAVTLPECKMTDGMYDDDQPRVCQHIGGKGDPLPYSPAIVFPPQEMPAVAAFNEIGTTLISGNLEALNVTTSSYASKDRIIGQLSEKFGRPDTVYAETIILHGIPLPSTAAIWRRAGFTVIYHSIMWRVASGQVRIETDRAIAARDAEAHTEEQKRTAL